MSAFTRIGDRLLGLALGTTTADAVCGVDHRFDQYQCKNHHLRKRTCTVYTNGCPTRCSSWRDTGNYCVN